MKPSEILLVALPSSVLNVVLHATQQAFPGVSATQLDRWESAGSGRAGGPSLLILAGDGDIARATQVMDGGGLPRWAVVVVGGRDTAELAETIPLEDCNPPLLARVFRSVLLQHQLFCENLRLRGDLKTVARRISHDLRTPLGCIHTTAEILPEIDTASLGSMAAVIKQSSTEISGIIDRVAFLLKASTEPAIPVPIEMAGVLDSVIGELETEGRLKRAQVILPANWPVVAGVAPWLAVIWKNLLCNALRHGAQGTPIRITWKQGSGENHFIVASAGPDVPVAREKDLFLPFDRLHQSRSRGLGLSIVERLVRMQGGHCAYQRPGIGEGAFYFTLPSDARF